MLKTIKELLNIFDAGENGFWNFRFSPVSIFLIASVSSVLFLVRCDIRGVFWLLDWVNLTVHETGHVVFGLPGNRFIMVLGGTLAQLMMPAAFFFYFLMNSQPKSSDACLFWLGENFLHIGKYVADARAQELNLVGGGVHDWTYLLEVFGLLPKDVQTGHFVDFIGCLVMVLAVYSFFEHLSSKTPPPVKTGG